MLMGKRGKVSSSSHTGSTVGNVEESNNNRKVGE